jgi:hypothetical protein
MAQRPLAAGPGLHDIEYDYFVLTGVLIRSGDLEERSIDDRAAVGRALGAWIDRLLTRVSPATGGSSIPQVCKTGSAP